MRMLNRHGHTVDLWALERKRKAFSKEPTVLYFAYGSNLNLERMKWRVDNYEKICNYILKDHKLVFNIGSGCAYANVLPKQGSEVEGVIYRISAFDLKSLDRCEAVPINYIRSSFDYKGEECFIYLGMLETEKYPTAEYLQIIQKGCIDHKLVKTLDLINKYIIKNINKLQ